MATPATTIPSRGTRRRPDRQPIAAPTPTARPARRRPGPSWAGMSRRPHRRRTDHRAAAVVLLPTRHSSDPHQQHRRRAGFSPQPRGSSIRASSTVATRLSWTHCSVPSMSSCASAATVRAMRPVPVLLPPPTHRRCCAAVPGGAPGGPVESWPAFDFVATQLLPSIVAACGAIDASDRTVYAELCGLVSTVCRVFQAAFTETAVKPLFLGHFAPAAAAAAAVTTTTAPETGAVRGRLLPIYISAVLAYPAHAPYDCAALVAFLHQTFLDVCREQGGWRSAHLTAFCAAFDDVWCVSRHSRTPRRGPPSADGDPDRASTVLACRCGVIGIAIIIDSGRSVCVAELVELLWELLVHPEAAVRRGVASVFGTVVPHLTAATIGCVAAPGLAGAPAHACLLWPAASHAATDDS